MPTDPWHIYKYKADEDTLLFLQKSTEHLLPPWVQVLCVEEEDKPMLEINEQELAHVAS
jgi:hypothetical protein